VHLSLLLFLAKNKSLLHFSVGAQSCYWVHSSKGKMTQIGGKNW
jgi:hypothetical protein